ncbi:MAG: MBL fold metallo-hydrolase [Clostridiales bacterium]|jgi:glyoxylase-like metal-dependent hydrolase (beta-lactamase superfamily II)|nr:MBL fold metallo-hydrolase [Clostridiales bacterium]
MTKIHFRVGALQTNCFLIADDETREAALIDPGGGTKTISAAIRDKGIQLKYILFTHGHDDHTGAAISLAKEFDVPVYLHPADRSIGRKLSLLYSEGIDIKPLADGDKLYLGSTPIDVLHTPGHSGGSCVFITGKDMFSGDTLFAGSCGRVDFPGGDARQMRASLKRLYDLPGDYNVYPGHMDFTTLERERETNFYMEEFRT